MIARQSTKLFTLLQNCNLCPNIAEIDIGVSGTVATDGNTYIATFIHEAKRTAFMHSVPGTRHRNNNNSLKLKIGYLQHVQYMSGIT